MKIKKKNKPKKKLWNEIYDAESMRFMRDGEKGSQIGDISSNNTNFDVHEANLLLQGGDGGLTSSKLITK